MFASNYSSHQNIFLRDWPTLLVGNSDYSHKTNTVITGCSNMRCYFDIKRKIIFFELNALLLNFLLLNHKEAFVIALLITSLKSLTDVGVLM